jgi:hypothetical protein
VQTINKVVLNGKVYKLQHPGNREWLRLKATLLDIQKNQINMENLLDYCFEHVVFPEKNEKLTIDNCDIEELEVWQEVLPRFLRGKLETGYIWPDTRSAVKQGKKLLQTESQD